MIQIWKMFVRPQQTQWKFTEKICYSHSHYMLEMQRLAIFCLFRQNRFENSKLFSVAPQANNHLIRFLFCSRARNDETTSSHRYMKNCIAKVFFLLLFFFFFSLRKGKLLDICRLMRHTTMWRTAGYIIRMPYTHESHNFLSFSIK